MGKKRHHQKKPNITTAITQKCLIPFSVLKRTDTNLSRIGSTDCLLFRLGNDSGHGVRMVCRLRFGDKGCLRSTGFGNDCLSTS